MEREMESHCFCCGKLVCDGQAKKRRRLLSNPNLQTLLQTLYSLIKESSTEFSVDLTQLSTGYICRGCVELIERYQQLHKQLTTKLAGALPFLPKVPIEGRGAGTASQIQTVAMSAPLGSPVALSKSSSPAITAKIHYRSRSKSYTLTPSRRRICKPLVRTNYNSFALQCVKKNKGTKTAIVKVIGQVLQSDIAAICSDNYKSITRVKSKDSVQNFKYVIDSLINEMKSRAPTLLSLLKSCLKTKEPRRNTDAIVAVLTSIMCKHRRPSACLVQRIISLVLYTGHSSKQVFQRLQKIGLCLSHSKTVQLVGYLGEDFDTPVKLWKESVECNIRASQCEGTVTLQDDLSLQLSPVTVETDPTLTSTPVKKSIDPSSSGTELSSDTSMHSPDSPYSFSCTFDVSTSFGSHDFTELPLSEPLDVSQIPDTCIAICSTSNDSTLSMEVSDVICTVPKSVNAGFKLVFDNIDKTVHPRHMTVDSQSTSLHYVQAYAVKDRIDYSSISNERDQEGECNLYSILPDAQDYRVLKERLVVHVSRIITTYLTFFNKDFQSTVQKHIPHKFSTEMSTKSEVVPLGVLPKNETKYEDMIEILEEYKTYIPSKIVTLNEPLDDITEDKSYVTTLVGGDYLSVVRARGAQFIRRNSELEKHRLDGMLPVCEDWHAKVCLLEVFWKRLFRTSSGMEMGTLYQLRNLLNRRNVSKQPKKDVNAAEDFVEAVTTGHILTAVMAYLNMSSLEDLPSSAIISHDIWMEADEVRISALKDISAHIVEKHVDLATVFDNPLCQTTGTVYDYSCEVLSLGLLILDFKDAVREGDGDHIMLLWKYLMLVFKACGRKNYAIEALTLLTQYHMTLPPNLAEQMKWSRFINVHGLPGHNISCDLHMEHINRLVKVAIDGLGANKSEKAITRVGKAIGVLSKITESYDSEVGVATSGNKHSETSFAKDLTLIVQQLQNSDAFNQHSKATHKSFSHLRTNLIKTLDEKKLKKWMVERFSTTLLHDFTSLMNTDSEDSM